MPVGPPGAIEAAPIEDLVMLAILGNGGRHGRPLSADEERLLDDWADGRLVPDGVAAGAAAALVRDNALAAERLLERRLLDLAARAPEAPRIATPVASSAPRRGAPPAPPSPAHRPWLLPPWRWPALAGGLVLASMLAVASVPLLREAIQGEAPLHLALVSIADRSALFEPSDIRLRGGERAPVPAAERRFRDAEVPAAFVKGLFADTGPPSPAVARQVEALLPLATRRPPARVLLDAALRARAVAAAPDMTLPVRVYDLDDPRAADLRAALGVSPGPGDRLYLLTVRP